MTKRFIVEGPDGKRYIVEGPSEGPAPAPVGGSPGAAVQNVPEGPKIFQRAGGHGPLHAGVGDAAIKGVLGVKQLLGLGSKEDQAVLEQIRQESDADPEGGWRTAGNVAGNLAMTALPGGAMAKGIQGIGKLGALAPLAAAVGSSAGTEFITAPVEGDSYGEVLANKGKEALKAGAAGGAIFGASKLVTKPFTGLFKASPEAAKLYDQGINPTLQQGAGGAPGKFVGGLTAGVQNLKQRLNDEGADAVLKRATEGKVSMREGTGEEYARAARDYVGNEYDKLWAGKRVQLSPRHREAVVSRAGVVPADGVGRDEAAQAVRIMENRMGVQDGVADATTNYPLNPETFRARFRKPITDAAMEADSAVRARVLEARALLDKLVTTKNLTRAERARLQEINGLNFDATRLEEAVGSGNQAKEGVDLGRLNKAYSAMLNQGRSIGNTTYDDIIAPLTRVMANTPNQNTARSMKAAAVKLAGPAAVAAAAGGIPAAGAAVAVPYAISLYGQTASGARKLLGQEEWQKKLAEFLRNYQPGAAGVAGSALTQE